MSIKFNEKTKTFYLDGKGFTYAFKINENNVAEHLYFGETIAHDDISYVRHGGSGSTQATIPGRDGHFYSTYLPEIAFHGTGDYREPCVCVENETGDRLCELLYDSHEILDKKPKINGMPSLDGEQTLVVHLKDKITNLAADVYYTVYEDTGIIARRIVYKNESDKTIKLTRAFSFTVNLPGNNYEVLSLYGAWACERNIERIPMHHGVVSIDSKRTTSSSVLNPFVAVLEPETNETRGKAYGFNLIYSSSYVLKVEGTNQGRTLITGGINDFDFAWNLNPEDKLETPEVVIAFSNEGLGGMSRAFHDVYREHLINKRFVNKPRPIVINNWEGTYFDFNNQKLMDIVSAVEGTGIDTFVLDDGWFGIRNGDRSGLGDWVVNEEKLQGGLKAIIDHTHKCGMKFGLWFEPEMVNEDSDLFRAHPDWAIGTPNRQRCYSRHQYMLDLTRKDVRDYIVNSVNKVLNENEIDYVKWDYNRNVTESYSFQLKPEQQKEFAHRYALGLYDLCERIVNGNPDIIFEGCAGGGGRFDPAILHYFPQIWTSDDSDANERTKIQYGTSMSYPLSSMSCHFSVVPNHQTGRITPAKSRADIAHLGAFGYELDTSDFTEDDRKMVKEQIAKYKEMQDLILKGDLYRFENPFESNYFGFNVVSKDKTKAVITAFVKLCHPNPEAKFIYPTGLDKNKNYYIKELDKTLSGSTIMNVGLFIDIRGGGDFRTFNFTLTET